MLETSDFMEPSIDQASDEESIDAAPERSNIRPRQKWRYLPADSDLNQPDGRLKKSYRIHCPICDKILWRQNLHQHMRSHSGDRPYKCDVCSKMFGNSIDLRRHAIVHEDRSKRLWYQCPFCEWSGLGNLSRHVRTKHKGMRYDPSMVVTRTAPLEAPPVADPTMIDDQSSNSIATIVDEVFQAVINDAYQPPIDDELWEEAISRVEQELRQDPAEIMRSWTIPRIECNICWRVIRRGNFSEHRRIHETTRHFQCSICNEYFRFRKSYVQHLREHSGLKSIEKHRQKNQDPSKEKSISLPWRIRKSICYICGNLISQAKMAHHLKMHEEGEKEWPCDQCSKKYRSNYFLRLHKARVHEGKLPYKCFKCDYRSSRRSHVVDHLLKKHGEIVDRSVNLVQGLSTSFHWPTRRCPICDVHVFFENYEIHQKKHSQPEEYERMKSEKEQDFRKLITEQKKERRSCQATQRMAKKLLNSARKKSMDPGKATENPKEPIRKSERNRQKTQQKLIRYQCLMCKIGFRNVGELIEHDKSVHNSEAV